MRQHAAAIDPFPLEEVVWKQIGLVPIHLDREEAVDPGPAQNLRHPAGESEYVGQPGYPVALAEGLLEVTLPVDDVANQCFATGHVAVGLEPHAAARLPPPLGHPLLDSREDAGSSSSIHAYACAEDWLKVKSG